MRSDAIGILGGTFDPIHYGHLRLAAEARTALELPEVRLIPAGDPPHRMAPVAPAQDRLAMTELGCTEFAGIKADGREVHRTGPSYTLLTLEELHAELPMRPLVLLIGTDAFAGLTAWHRWERLFTLAHFVVVERPGQPLAPESLAPALRVQWDRRLCTDRARLARQLAGSIYKLAVTPQPISASAIRAALARGRAGRDQIRGLLPAAVLAYIDRNQLYRAAPDAP